MNKQACGWQSLLTTPHIQLQVIPVYTMGFCGVGGGASACELGVTSSCDGPGAELPEDIVLLQHCT